ncbi:hypothetical protein NF699_02770 [Sphingomonadaceae bacterium OTU29LAMAA1]|nr:hypothetical protein NF699_02770 [Sphingomonadaceae bacterium OTU29LAMAA1]
MSKINLMRSGAVAAAALVAVSGSSLFAQNAGRSNVRGSVISASATSLKVKSREGKVVDVALADGWKITSLARSSVAAIKPGDFVGIASTKNAKGDRALEVLIFPPALKGLGEGSYGWDLKPQSSMTNASVTSKVKGVNGQTVSLSYSGGQKNITIPPSAPVVTFAPATSADLKPGARVFVGAEVAGGKLVAHQVVVGKNGVVPPM